MEAILSPSVYSSLVKENIKQYQDFKCKENDYNVKEGLLLGFISQKTEDIRTDTEENVLVSKQIVTITGMLTFPLPMMFYNSFGQLNENFLNDYKHERLDNVVGWFNFTPYLKELFSFQEAITTQQLKSFYNNDHMVFLNGSVSKNQKKSKYEIALRFYEFSNTFNEIQCTIDNLDARLAKTEYETSGNSRVYNYILKQVENELQKGDMDTANRIIEDSTNVSLEEIKKRRDEEQKLIVEINELKTKLRERKLKNKQMN